MISVSVSPSSISGTMAGHASLYTSIPGLIDLSSLPYTSLPIVALVAMTPLLSIQIVGLIFKIKSNRKSRLASSYFADMLSHEGEIIDVSFLKDKSSARKMVRMSIDERIIDLRQQIETLKNELNAKKSQLARYEKRKNMLKKKED